jgi:hypothetical protein
VKGDGSVKGIVADRAVNVLSVATVVTAVLQSNAAPAIAAPFDFNPPISRAATLECLQPLDESMDQGVPIVQKPCVATRVSCSSSAACLAQDWGLVSLGGNRYRLLNHLSGLCMDARGNAVNGTPVVQWPCATISNQTWDTGHTIPDIVALTSRVSDTDSHCLDVPGGQASPDVPLQIYACNGTSAQAWVIGSGL